jgi:hypothetical protein
MDFWRPNGNGVCPQLWGLATERSRIPAVGICPQPGYSLNCCRKIFDLSLTA